MRYDWEPFRVGLLLTNKCNIKCDHCWLDSGPKRNEEMKYDEAERYIDQIDEINSIKWISFTGGEPLLRYKELLKLVKYASYKNFYTECVTNCYWASSPSKSMEILEPLADLGLNVINISSDDFHQKYIPFKNVVYCYQAARDLNLKIVIMCMITKTSTLTVNNIAHRIDPKNIQIIGMQRKWRKINAIAMEEAVVPIGRASKIPKEEILYGYKNVRGPCRKILRDIGIHPNGDVSPCCSAIGTLKKASLGNIKKYNLSNMIEKARNNPLFETLWKEGPQGLRDVKDGSKKYVNKCHMCYEILKKIKA